MIFLISTAIINNSYQSLTNAVAISNQAIKAVAINSVIDSIKDIYDGQPIPVDSNGRVHSEAHQNTGPETGRAWAYLNHNDNLKPYMYNKLQPSDKAAYDQYIKDRNHYVNELNDGQSHLDDYKKVLDEFNKLNDYGNKYPESVVPGPPCWWHGRNGWQSKDNIKNVWIAGIGFISDTPDQNGSYLDVEPSFLMRHNAITGQTSFQDVIGGIYIGMPDGSSHCSNYINKSGVVTVVPPKGYKFNVKESYQLEPYLTLKYKGKPMLISLTPDKAVFDFQVYADAGYQTIGTMVTPIPGHPGYYKMDNNHYFQLVVTPNGHPTGALNLDPPNKNDYQDTIDWEEDISPTLTSNFGYGDRKPGALTRTVITMHTNGQDPKKMSNADRTFVVVAPAGWQFQNIRKSKTMGPDWAQFEYNDVHDTRDSDWKKGDKLVRAPIDDGTTKTLYATPDQAHIGFFDFNRKFMSFNGQPTLGGTSHGGYDRLWLLPDQTWKGLPGQKKDQAFVEPVSKTGATIDAKDMTIKQGDKTDFSKVNATDWMGKATTASLVKGNVDVNKPGKYTLTYENTNSFGIKSDKTITVTVQGDQPSVKSSASSGSSKKLPVSSSAKSSTKSSSVVSRSIESSLSSSTKSMSIANNMAKSSSNNHDVKHESVERSISSSINHKSSVSVDTTSSKARVESTHKQLINGESVYESSSISRSSSSNDESYHKSSNLKSSSLTDSSSIKSSSHASSDVKTSSHASSSSESASTKTSSHASSSMLNSSSVQHVSSTESTSHNVNNRKTNDHVTGQQSANFAQTGGTKQVSHNWLYNLIYNKLPNWLSHL